MYGLRYILELETGTAHGVSPLFNSLFSETDKLVGCCTLFYYAGKIAFPYQLFLGVGFFLSLRSAPVTMGT